jgi:hypothetical protein
MTARRKEEKNGMSKAAGAVGRVTAISHDRCDAKYSAGKVGALPY